MKNMSFILLIFILAGCATTTDRFKLVSTQVSSGTPVGSNDKVVGESCRRSILLIPYEKDGTLEGAVEDALSKAKDANALSNLKVKKESLFTFFYNYRCLVVEGTAVKLK